MPGAAPTAIPQAAPPSAGPSAPDAAPSVPEPPAAAAASKGASEGIDGIRAAWTDIEQAIEDLKAVLKSDDKDAIEAKTQALAERSGKLAEKLYAQKGGAEAGRAETAEAEAGSGAADDVVDAEFEEVKDDKK